MVQRLRGRVPAIAALVGGVTLVVWVGGALAEGSAATGGEAGALWRVALDMGTKLLGVLAFIALLAWLLARVALRGGAVPFRGGRLRVLESVALGPSRGVYLVRAGGRLLVLGVTPQQVTPLAVLPEGDAQPPDEVAPHQSPEELLAAGQRNAVAPPPGRGG